MPLACVVATGCEHIPRVSTSSKSYERKRKGNVIYVPFLRRTKIPKSVFRISRSFYHSNLDTFPTVAPPWHCQPMGTIKMGVYGVTGELFANDR
jgi:hypothetical protein